MPIERANMEDATPFDQLKILLVGPEKHGKSNCAATARKPVLVFDFDQRREAIAGKKGVYVITFKDPQWPNMPEAASMCLDVLTKLEQEADLASLGFNAPPGLKPKTIVFDSVATMGKAFSAYALYNNKSLRRTINIAGKIEVHFPSSWDGWEAESKPVESVILRTMGLGLDVIAILHATAEEAPDSTEDKPKYTGRISVYPARYRRLLKYFNETWMLKLTPVNGVYVPRVYPRPTWDFDASTAMELNAIEEPNIEMMVKKHEERKNAKM